MIQLLLLAACAGGGDGPKDKDTAGTVDCAANPEVDLSATAYAETTSAWGLDGVTGTKFAAGDLDGDGWPDLLVTEGFSNARDDLAAGVRYHWLLLNREEGGRRVFVDHTEASGYLVNRDGTVGTSANLYVLGDVDADGDLDIFAGRAYDAGTTDATGDCSEVYLNDGAASFTLAPASDICVPGGYPTAGAAFTDVDADGRLDLWITGWYEAYGQSLQSANPQLHLGQGDGTFREVTDDAGLKLKACGRTDYCLDRGDRFPGEGATACDVNGDALPDLIQSNYARSWNSLFVNQGDGTFVDVGEASAFASDDNYDYSDNTRYACWCEANGPCDPAPTVDCDGMWPPEYWTPGYDDQPARNNGNSFTTVCADVDNDGDNDLYTTEIVHKWAGLSSDGTQLLLNDGTGAFTRVDNADNGLARRRPQLGDWNEGDLHAAFFDYDHDGWKDILLVSSDYPDTQLWHWRQVAPGQFEDVSDQSGLNQPWPAGIAVADFDLDGDLDVITGSSTTRSGTPWTDHQVHLYENQLGGGNWLRLTGLPVGARVEVAADGQVQMQEVSGGYGVSGIGNDPALTFGLGGACVVDAITATLPGGEVRQWGPLAGNAAVDLAEGG